MADDYLFQGRRPRPVDEFRDEVIEETRRAEFNRTAAEAYAMERAEQAADEREHKAIAAKVYCPDCYAPVGELCPQSEPHYGRRARYAAGGNDAS